MSNVASRLDPGSGRGVNLDRKMREQREAAAAAEQEKKRKAAEDQAARAEQARLEAEAEAAAKAREEKKKAEAAKQEAARKAQTREDAEARERERLAALQAERARAEAAETTTQPQDTQESANSASGTSVGVSPVANDMIASRPSGELYGGAKTTPPASMEVQAQARRRARPIPPDTKYVTVKNFPAHLLNLAKSRYPGRVNLTHADALAIELIEALNIPMSEAKEILAGRTAAIEALKAERKEIAHEEGLRDWARVIEKKIDNLSRDVNEVRVVTLYDALNYTGDVDNPHAPDVVSFNKDGVRNMVDKLKDEAASIGRTMRSRDVPIR